MQIDVQTGGQGKSAYLAEAIRRLPFISHNQHSEQRLKGRTRGQRGSEGI